MNRHERVPVHVHLNGAERTLDVQMHDSLLDALREAGLVGAKRACETSDCGACAVLLDGKLVNSCSTLALQAEGRRIDTIEALADRQSLHPLQEAFLAHGAAQCGFCIPGQLVSAQALLASNPHPTREEVEDGLAGNLCRCAGYGQIIEAVLLAASDEGPSERPASASGRHDVAATPDAEVAPQ